MDNLEWIEYREKIINKLSQEPEKIYGQIKNKQAKGNDWVTGLCPFHDDNKNSFAYNNKTLQFACFAGCGKGSVFDFIMHSSGKDFKNTLLDIGDSVGIPRPATKQKSPINEKLIEKWIGYLCANEKIIRYLREKRGLFSATIKKYEIGWDPKRERNTIPVRDERGNVVNVRLYNAKKEQKIINYTDKNYKYGSPARLYGLPELIKSKQKQVLIVEGEWDRLILQQEGFTAVTGTHGAGTFRPEWLQYFEGKDVIIIYDCDKEGQAAVNNIVLKAFKNSNIRSIKNVILPLKGDKNDKDITDYFHKRGCTANDLKTIINETPIYSYQQEIVEEEIIKINTFADIEKEEYIDKKVQCEITVCGETSEAFHAVEEFDVIFCPKLNSGKCFNCTETIIVSRGSREYVGCCMISDFHLKSMLRNYCCKYGQKPTLDIKKRTTIKEFFCHQVVSTLLHNEEIIEKKVYYISSLHPKPGNYVATGWIKSHPKTQMVTFLIEKMDRIEDDFSQFDTDDNIEYLKAFQKLSFAEILEHLTNEVTGIYERDEILAAILLTYCSPRWIPFNREEIRGWLISVIIGDAGAGKSQTYQKIANYIGIGDCFSALTGSRTGLTYALVEHAQKGWQVKIGRYPANTRKLLIVDEGQFLPEEDWRTISIAMETGFLKIDRVTSRGYESQTRLIIVANPKRDQIMDLFAFGCESLASLFPPTLIRRTDLAVFVNSSDIKDSTIINKRRDKSHQVVTPKMLRSVIYWTWNLEPNQIFFDPKAEAYCMDQATNLSKVYGFATNIPLITVSDCRNTLARISTAFAALLMSTNEDFSQLIVKKEHVNIAMNLINKLYSHENCILNGYSDIMRHGSQLLDYDKIEMSFLEKWEREKHGGAGENYFSNIVYLLYVNRTIRRDDLIEQVECSKEPVSQSIRLLKRYNLIDSCKSGYIKKPKFNKFLRKFIGQHEEFFEGVR